MPITFWAKVLGETFWAKVLGETFLFLEPHFASGAGRWAGQRGWAGGWAGLGWAGGWAGRWGAALKLKLVYSKMAKLCPDRKYELSNGQQQQAISIYFFLEGLGSRV